MSNYNSTHTGAELDTAISAVLTGGSMDNRVSALEEVDSGTRLTAAEEDIDDLQEAVSGIDTEIGGLQDLIVKDVLKPASYGTASANSYPGNVLRFPCSANNSNAAYRGKTIVGIKVDMYNSGTLTVVKANVTEGSTTQPTTTTVESFTVTTGQQTLMFDNPFVITDEDEFIGFLGGGTQNASFKYDVNGSTTKFLYWRNDNNKVMSSNGSLSVAIIIANDIDGRMDALEEDVADIQAETDVIPVLEQQVVALNQSEVLVSPYFDTATSPQSAGAYRYYCGYSGGYTNAAYKGKSIIGFRVKVNAAGKIMVAIGHNIYSGSTTSSVEDVLDSAISIKTGANTIMLPSPITITDDNDMIAFKTTTAKIVSKTTNGSVAFMYLDSSTGKIKGSRSQLSLALIISDPIVDRVSTLETQMAAIGDVSIYNERITACENTDASQNRQLRMLNPAYIEQPYFYHWNPNDFIPQGGQSKGIPSQSIEDNFLAKRLGFAFVEANIQETADGELVVSHGISGKLGAEFPSAYQDTEFSSLTLDELKAINYDSYYKCYQHPVPTADEFFRNCAQLGMGVNIRDNSASVVAIARKYLPDNMFSISAGATVRTSRNFAGMIGYYVTINSSTSTSEIVCNIDYLRNIANTYGGAPFHISMHGSHIDYMIANNTLDSIVSTLRSEGIYIGAAYCSHKTADRLVAVGGIGIASDAWQCNIFDDANVGAWSLVDSLDGWTIPSGVSVVGGTITNSGNSNIEISTPTTGALQLAKGCVQARLTGKASFAIAGSTNTYENYTVAVPISFAKARIGNEMKLTVTIYPSSTLEFLSYKVSRC